MIVALTLPFADFLHLSSKQSLGFVAELTAAFEHSLFLFVAF